jgi:hypothetical protein
MKLFLSLLAATTLAQGAESGWAEKLAFWVHGEVNGMTQRIAAIDRALGRLPELALINSCTRVGLKTGAETDDDEPWLELILASASRSSTRRIRRAW